MQNHQHIAVGLILFAIGILIAVGTYSHSIAAATLYGSTLAAHDDGTAIPATKDAFVSAKNAGLLRGLGEEGNRWCRRGPDELRIWGIVLLVAAVIMLGMFYGYGVRYTGAFTNYYGIAAIFLGIAVIIGTSIYSHCAAGAAMYASCQAALSDGALGTFAAADNWYTSGVLNPGPQYLVNLTREGVRWARKAQVEATTWAVILLVAMLLLVVFAWSRPRH